MINKQLFDVCEELGWMVYEDDDMIELQMFSPAGEDFSFSVDKNFFVEDVIAYAESFDSQEHAAFWMVTRYRDNQTGIPSARELVEDADEIQAELTMLARELWALKEGMRCM